MSWIVDTGPLVALLNRREAHHQWAKAWFNVIAPPSRVCAPVLTEACFLVKRNGGDPAEILDMVTAGLLRVDFDVQAHAGRLSALLRKYADRPMSLADACLVLLSDAHPDARLLTTDTADFAVYGRTDGTPVPAAFPHDLPA